MTEVENFTLHFSCLYVYIQGCRKKRQTGSQYPILCFSYKKTASDCDGGLKTAEGDWNIGQVNNLVFNQLKRADGKVINDKHYSNIYMFFSLVRI